jgi:thiol-disulfide isomerase/thioredoxin
MGTFIRIFRAWLIIIAFIFSVLDLYSQNKSINFVEKPWQDIVYMAREQKKLIFLDAYTTWCGPCKWMAANMFTEDTVADLYNSQFICAHFDMEKGEGPKLASLYKISAYPTLLFIDGNGDLIHKRVGAPQKISDYVEMARVAQTPGEGFAAVLKKYEEGNREPAFMYTFFERMQGAYMPVGDAVNQYFGAMNDSSFMLRENWNILYQYVTDMNSPIFRRFEKNRFGFERNFGKDSVNQKFFNVYLQSLAMMPRNRNFTEAEYNTAKQRIRDSGFSEADKVLFTADLYIYQMRGEISKFLELGYDQLDQFYPDDPSFLNQMASGFLQMTEDEKYLRKASQWSASAFSLVKSAEFADTFAQLQYKMGNVEEAVRYGKMAVELAEKEKVASAKYVDNLKKYQESR